MVPSFLLHSLPSCYSHFAPADSQSRLAVLILVPLGRRLPARPAASLARLSLPAAPSLPPPNAAPHPSCAVFACHHGGRTTSELSSPTPRVVAVTSGKGGVGKTTAAANHTASLVRLSLPVVPINTSLRNLDILVGLENHVHLTAANVLAGNCRL